MYFWYISRGIRKLSHSVVFVLHMFPPFLDSGAVQGSDLVFFTVVCPDAPIQYLYCLPVLWSREQATCVFYFCDVKSTFPDTEMPLTEIYW